MSLLDNQNHSTDELYVKYLQFTGVILEDYEPIEIAGIMVIQALSLYRSCLSEEDYQKMVKTIYDHRDQVKTF